MSLLLSQLHQLISELAHEIKNPIGTGITAISHLKKKTEEIDLLFESGTLTKNQLREFLNLSAETARILENNCNRAAKLIQSLKQLSSLQSRNTKQQINLFSFLSDIQISISPRLKRNRTTLEIHGDTQLTVAVYPDMLYQIIDNLIINSLTHGFSASDGGKISIDFTLRSEELIITYTDNGSGIPEEHQPHIFEEHYTTAGNSESSGLGMHIVQQLVTRHMDGTISLASESGKGTTFIISLPV